MPMTGPWYSGSTNAIDRFSLAFVGRGNDQLGPGIYFSSDRANASHYGPIVHAADIEWQRVVEDPWKHMPRAVLERILRAGFASAEWPIDALNWDERPAVAEDMVWQAHGGQTWLEVLHQIAGTFSHFERRPADLLKILVDSGYTGMVVPAGSTWRRPTLERARAERAGGVKWAVVWDAEAITITDRADNPAWVDRTITDTFSLLSQPGPAPIVRSVHKGGGSLLHADTLGCGHYGCVLDTEAPDVVLKLTTDRSEALFVAMLLERPALQHPGLVKYYAVKHTNRERYSAPIVAIWRERAEDVGTTMPYRLLDEDGRATPSGMLMRFQIITGDIRKQLMSLRREARRQVILDAKTASAAAAKHVWINAETGLPAFDQIAAPGLRLAVMLLAAEQSAELLAATSAVGAALAALLKRGIVLADVHRDNVGRVVRNGVPSDAITDPGHMVLLDPSRALS